jgi:hypothetical protein
MEGDSNDATGWELRAQPGLTVNASRTVAEGVGEGIEAQLAICYDEPTFRLHVVSYTRTVVGAVDETPDPRGLIERWANEPGNAVDLIDLRHTDVPTAAFAMMRLPDAKRPGKKPDDFYARVLIFKRMCENAGMPYGERLAEDNDVSVHTVFRWVNEAKRRGITLDDDEVGQVRIEGEPMTMSGAR